MLKRNFTLLKCHLAGVNTYFTRANLTDSAFFASFSYIRTKKNANNVLCNIKIAIFAHEIKSETVREGSILWHV